MPKLTKGSLSRTFADPGDVRHMLRRVAFAATPATDSALCRMPVEKAFDSLIDAAKKARQPAPPEFVRTVWTNSALRFPETSSKEYQTMRAAQSEENQRDIELLRHWWLREMITGPSPLRENLVLFFHGTFGSSTGSVDMPQALHGVNALLRRSCLGTIPAMLEQLVLDPSMMIQIGMDEYRKEKLSEVPPNYRPAKLILDNWTVGSGKYSDADVTELCRALTGWLLVAPRGHEPKKPVDPKAFRSARRTGLVPVFQPEHFVHGSKTILGKRAEFDARSAIGFLARHPATARRFSRLLIQYVGIDDANRQLESRLAETYRVTGGSVVALLRDIVVSEEFWSADSRWRLIKSPVQLAVSACRQLEITEPPLAEISSWLAVTGQKLFNTPNFGDAGWPGQEAWVTPADRLAVRYQLGLVLAGQMPKLGINVADASPAQQTTSVRRIFSRPLQSATTAALLERLDPAPGIDPSEIERRIAGLAPDGRATETVRHIVATPQYQLA